MTIIDRKPIPLYVKKCIECGSTFTYLREEVGLGRCLICPVCGYDYLWADYERVKDETGKK